MFCAYFLWIKIKEHKTGVEFVETEFLGTVFVETMFFEGVEAVEMMLSVELKMGDSVEMML